MHLAKVDKKAKAKKEKKQKEDKEKQDRKDNKAKRDLEKLEKNALDAKQEAQDEADANAASAAAADMTEEQRAAAREEVLAKLETPLEKMKIKQLLGLLEERGRPCLKCKGAEKSHIVSQVSRKVAHGVAKWHIVSQSGTSCRRFATPLRPKLCTSSSHPHTLARLYLLYWLPI